MKIKKEIAYRKINGEYFIVNPRNTTLYMPENPVAEFIWERVSQGKNFEEILNQIIEEFDVDEETARNDLTQFLYELKEEGIIE